MEKLRLRLARVRLVIRARLGVRARLVLSARLALPVAEAWRVPNFVALLRGINVGGHKLVKMEVLARLCVSMGLREARTYLQSGNVVFQHDGADRSELAARMEKKIKQTFGFEVKVIVRTGDDLKAVIRKNPFPEAAQKDPSCLAVMFLSRRPGWRVVASLMDGHHGPEEMRLAGENLFVYYRAGIGRSKLSKAALEKALQVYGTARNWNTIAKLEAMAQGLKDH